MKKFIEKIILINLVVFFTLQTNIYSQSKLDTLNIMRKGPYLIFNGNNTEMQVLWQLRKSEICSIKWGNDTLLSLGNKNTSEYGNDHQHKYLLTNLKPGNKYYYQIKVNNNIFNGSFHSAPPKNSDKVNFFAYGDTRTYPAITIM